MSEAPIKYGDVDPGVLDAVITNKASARIAALRRIVATSTSAKVEGIRVDLFSAGAIVQVYDALTPANRETYIRLPITKMATVAFKLLK